MFSEPEASALTSLARLISPFRRLIWSVVEVLRDGRPATGVGRRGQAGGLQVLVGDPLDALDLDAHADAVDHQRLLVDGLAHVPGRVDVGDIVRDHAQRRLGGLQARRGGLQSDAQGHRLTLRPAKADARPGGFCRGFEVRPRVGPGKIQ
jgi:hypothetical protein